MEKIKSYLEDKQEQIKKQLRSVDNDDPLLVDPVTGSCELGTAVWESEVHLAITARKSSLKDVSEGIEKSLEKIELGTYGICEGCGKNIETERLKILPTTSSCKSCAASSN